MRRVTALMIGGIASAAPAMLRDIAGAAGAGLVIYGVWWIYQPAGFIVCGLFLLIAALLSARRS